MQPEASGQGFIDTQRRFVAYVRDPDNTPRPVGVPAQRMDVYAELLFNNINEQLGTNFPVLHEILAGDRWDALVRDFMVRHRCTTPLFTEIGQEFIAFLRDLRADQADDPAFLLELAHYEWVDLALYIDDTVIDRDRIDPNADLLAHRPVVSPQAWPLSYAFDVHRIGPDYQPESPPDEPTYLVVYRDRDDEVGFLEVNPVTYRLLELLDSEQAGTGRDFALQIASELNHPDPEVVVAGAADILDGLREREIVIGARIND